MTLLIPPINRRIYHTGLIDLHIKVKEPGDTVTVIIYLPEPAPDNYQWYKYSNTAGWHPYNAQFNKERAPVTITLTDGQTKKGEDDGKLNGIIIDPSGLGISSAPDAENDPDGEPGPANEANPGASIEDDEPDDSGCFIETAQTKKCKRP